ncbi:MAG TPA: MarR family transcriptional regulator [Xanthobacteraceae bacterium]|jgi:MarR family transcriptional regulator for hemolysin
MPKPSRRRELVFLLLDVARLVKTEADQRVRPLGMTRAQWAVLSRLERSEGLKQSELAEALEIKPITLTRLVDRLCASGLVERRPDLEDRRAKRLYLTPAARPLVDRLAQLGEVMMQDVLAGIEDRTIVFMIEQLLVAKDNLRVPKLSRSSPTTSAAA